jgi:EmrB/QacA subfamily drug resistance transporter
MDIAPAEAIVSDTLPTEPMPVFTHTQIVGVLTGIVLCILLAAIDQTVVVPAVPAIAADLNGFNHLSWIVAAYLVTSVSTTPIYGKLSDGLGRRALLLPAIVLFVVASGLCALSRTLNELIVFRALQGVGGGGLLSMAQAAIADVIAPRERGRYQGYMAGTWAIASLFGPVLGGWIVQYLSWPWIFWINLPLGAAAFVLSNRALKILKPRRVPIRIDYLGAILLTSFITLFLLVMSWGGVEYAWDSPEVIWSSVTVVVLLALLVIQERRSPDALLPPILFVNPVFVCGIILACMASAVMLGMTFVLPLFFQLLRGADPASSGSRLVPMLAVGPIGAFTGGSLTRKLGRVKPIILVGTAVMVAGLSLMAMMDASTPTPLVILYMMMVGVSTGLCGPTALVATQNSVTRAQLGVATSTLLFCRTMGGGFGSTLFGAILTSRFNAGLALRGVSPDIHLGDLRRNGIPAHLDAHTLALSRDALALGFHWSFAAAGVVALVAFLAAAGIRDLPLQSVRTR